VIEDVDWIDPVRLEARVAGAVARARGPLTDPRQASVTQRRLLEELARDLGAAGIPDSQAVAHGLLQAAFDRAGVFATEIEAGEALAVIARVKRRFGVRQLGGPKR
jgi:hypothetical protein